jgi:hypothetical protein
MELVGIRRPATDVLVQALVPQHVEHLVGVLRPQRRQQQSLGRDLASDGAWTLGVRPVAHRHSLPDLTAANRI